MLYVVYVILLYVILLYVICYIVICYMLYVILLYVILLYVWGGGGYFFVVILCILFIYNYVKNYNVIMERFYLIFQHIPSIRYSLICFPFLIKLIWSNVVCLYLQVSISFHCKKVSTCPKYRVHSVLKLGQKRRSVLYNITKTFIGINIIMSSYFNLKTMVATAKLRKVFFQQNIWDRIQVPFSIE